MLRLVGREGNQVRTQLSYVANRLSNDPLVSNGFIRATNSGGVQVRFNLAE